MTADRQFAGDELRLFDPKFKSPNFSHYLKAVDELAILAKERFGKSVLALAVRWVLDRTENGIALWGARRPDQIAAVKEMDGFHLDSETLKDIDRI